MHGEVSDPHQSDPEYAQARAVLGCAGCLASLRAVLRCTNPMAGGQAQPADGNGGDRGQLPLGTAITLPAWPRFYLPVQLGVLMRTSFLFDSTHGE